MYGDDGPHPQVDGAACAAARRGACCGRGREAQVGGPERVACAQAEPRRALASFGDRQLLARAADDLEPAIRLERHDDVGIGARALDVVCDTDTHVELVARRDRSGRVRREHEVTAHQRAPVEHPDALVGDRDRHDAQRPVEVVGHGVLDVSRRRIGIEDARPVGDRRLALAPERVQVLAEHALRIAARRGGRPRRRNSGRIRSRIWVVETSQRPLLEEVAQRIRAPRSRPPAGCPRRRRTARCARVARCDSRS